MGRRIMAHEKSETVQNPIDNMFYNLDTVDDRHRRINPYDYFPEAELESPNVGVERGLGVLGGPYKTGEEGAEAARKRSMNFRGGKIMPNKNMQGQDLMSRMLPPYAARLPMEQSQPETGILPYEDEAVHRGPLAQRAFDTNQFRENLTRKLMKQGRAQDQMAAGMMNMDPRNTYTWKGLSAGADALGKAGKTIFDFTVPFGSSARKGGEQILEEYGPKLQQAILALMEMIQSGQKSFEKGYKPGMRLR